MGIYAPKIGVTAVMLPELDFQQQLALCGELKLDLYSIRPRVISDKARGEPYSNWGNHAFDLTPQRLLDEADRIVAQIRGAGLEPFGTLPAASTADAPDAIQLHLDGAKAAGAGRVRLNPENYPNGPFDFGPWLDTVIGKYREIVPEAEKRGLKLVMETHTRSVAVDCGIAREICRVFDPAVIGVIFDLPNFAREGNLQPNLAVSILEPWIDHVHVGAARRITQTAYDAAIMRRSAEQFCPLPEGDLNLVEWLNMLKAAGVDAPLIIEDFTPGPSGEDRLRRAAADLRIALNHINRS